MISMIGPVATLSNAAAGCDLTPITVAFWAAITLIVLVAYAVRFVMDEAEARRWAAHCRHMEANNKTETVDTDDAIAMPSAEDICLQEYLDGGVQVIERNGWGNWQRMESMQVQTAKAEAIRDNCDYSGVTVIESVVNVMDHVKWAVRTYVRSQVHWVITNLNTEAQAVVNGIERAQQVIETHIQMLGFEIEVTEARMVAKYWRTRAKTLATYHSVRTWVRDFIAMPARVRFLEEELLRATIDNAEAQALSHMLSEHNAELQIELMARKYGVSQENEAQL